MNQSTAEVREYGPFPGADSVHGVTYDGQQVWFASGEKLNAFDPANGKTVRSIDAVLSYRVAKIFTEKPVLTLPAKRRPSCA